MRRRPRDQPVTSRLMEASSQMAPVRRQPRPWTAKEQLIAEVACASGCSIQQVGRCLDRGARVVQLRLKPHMARMHLARSKQWQKANPDKVRAKSKKWYYENVLQARQAARLRRLNNPDKVSQAQRKWRKANFERVSEHWRSRAARKRMARFRALSPITLEQRRNRFRLFSNCCAYCQSAASLSVDHVLPIKHGGLDEASNIVPACLRCNSSKCARPVEDWYRHQPFFTEERWRKIQRHCTAAVAGQLPLALG